MLRVKEVATAERLISQLPEVHVVSTVVSSVSDTNDSVAEQMVPSSPGVSDRTGVRQGDVLQRSSIEVVIGTGATVPPSSVIGDTFEWRGSDAVWQPGRFVRPGRLSHRSRRTVSMVWMARSA